MAPAAQAPGSVAEARELGEQLQAEPIKRANLAVRLLEGVDARVEEATCRACIQDLLLFFIAACDEGHLRGVGGRGVAPSSSASAAAAADAATNAPPPSSSSSSVYSNWLARQYTAFTDRLFKLIRQGASPAAQTAAVGALLEAARHEDGPAKLGGPLAARVVAALARARRAAPEALALLMQRYLPHADVSYYAMRAVSKLAAQLGSAAQEAEEEEEEGEEGDDDKEAAAADVSDAPTADQMRTLFDLLCHLPTMPDSAAARAADASAITRRAPGAKLALGSGEGGGGGEGDGPPVVPPTSWCGALEAGLAVAASDSGASSKARRRKQQQQQQRQQKGGAAPPPSSATTTAVRWACGRSRRRAHASAWLALLGCSLPPDLLRKALVRAQQRVLPTLPDPGRLADFYTAALDQGGLDGMVALNGLFVLVTRHGLEYPRFYPRLYALLLGGDGPSGEGEEAGAGGAAGGAAQGGSGSLFALPPTQRARFLRLADTFLASPAVPAYSAAAFAKRFARVSLRSADPGLALVSLAFVHNLVRRHPSCAVLLHRPVAAAGAGGGGGGGAEPPVLLGQEELAPASKKMRKEQHQQQRQRWDVYDEAASDPADSRAVDSSLWEVAALRRHHCPHVAALAHKLAAKDLSDRKGTAEMDVVALLEASAGTLAQEDFGRRLKAAPATAARSDAETAALTLFSSEAGGEGVGEGLPSFFEGWALPPASSLKS